MRPLIATLFIVAGANAFAGIAIDSGPRPKNSVERTSDSQMNQDSDQMREPTQVPWLPNESQKSESNGQSDRVKENQVKYLGHKQSEIVYAVKDSHQSEETVYSQRPEELGVNSRPLIEALKKSSKTNNWVNINLNSSILQQRGAGPAMQMRGAAAGIGFGR